MLRKLSNFNKCSKIDVKPYFSSHAKLYVSITIFIRYSSSRGKTSLN